MHMHGSLALRLDLHDPLDPGIWRAALASALERSDEGLVVLDATRDVLFASARATHLLGRVGMHGGRRLPPTILVCLEEQLRSPDPRRVDRLPVVSGTGAVLLGSRPLPSASAPASVVLFLRSDGLRDEELYATLRDRYAMTRRGFQLAQLLREGLSNREIAARTGLRESTVKVSLHELYRACGVCSRTALVALVNRTAR